MLYFTLDHDLSINGVSRIVYGNAHNRIELDPRFDFDDFRINFNMDVTKWIDEEESDCIIDKVNVSAWVFHKTIINVDVDVYGHDVEYGELDPDFSKVIDCNRTIDSTILYKMVTEIVKKSASIAAYEVTKNITDEWSVEGF